MPSLYKCFLAVAFASVGPAIQPVQISAQPQKFRTFYDLNDPRVPKALKLGSRPFPLAGPTALATGVDGAIWYGTRIGLVRFDPRVAGQGRSQYFAGQRYLPDDDVKSLVADPSGGMWVRTRTGVSHIEFKCMTLAAKAEIFEARVRARHDRHGLVAPSILRVSGDVTTSQMRDDDNDGLWTSIYAAAECFRYSVTKSPEALASAIKSTEAVLFLEQVTGAHGFPARSFIRKGEPMPLDGQWHWTPNGKYYWKGDTSSDEIVGHFFIYGIATDLLPDVSLKRRISATTARIMDHILDHGYYLIDANGQPTRWGRWSPEYFRTEPADSPLNSLEILSFLKIAYHITANPRYESEYKKLVLQMGYAQRCAEYSQLHEELNYSDEELAMLSFYGLFRYEKDEALLKRYYRPAIDQWWENESREDNPLWTFIYAQSQPNLPLDMTNSVETLYRMPIDTIDWSVKNSQRLDVVLDNTLDRQDHRQAKTLLPRDELPVAKWNANPFDIDSDSGGHSEDDGAAFLLPYWLGRYHALLIGE